MRFFIARPKLTAERVREVGLGLLLALTGAGVCIAAAGRPGFTAFAIGVYFFPFWIGATIAVTGTLLAIQAVTRGRDGATDSDDEAQRLPRSSYQRVFMVVALAAGYVWLTPVLGFGLCTFLVVVTYMRAERAPWIQSLIIGAGWTAVGVIARTYAYIQLPTGYVGL